MKKVVILFSLVTLANAVLWGIPSKTNNSWQKVDGRADGSWSDAAHWTLGMPGASHYAYFPGGLGSFTVTFPKGDVEIKTSFRANVAEGEMVTFDGRGSNFRQGAREVDTYHHEPFGFRYKGAHFFNHQLYTGADSVIARSSFSEMTNFVVRLEGDGGPKLYFDQGYLDLYKPCGEYASNSATMLFAQGAAIGAEAFPYCGLVSFGENTFSRFREVNFQGNNHTNILEFTGGNHMFMDSFEAPDPQQTFVGKKTLSVIRVAGDANVAFRGAMRIGVTSGTFGDTSLRTFRLSAEDGGYLAVSNTLTQQNAGRLELEIKNGAVMDLASNISLASPASCTASVSAVDATLMIGGEFKLGGSDYATFYATNSVIDISSSGKYEQRSSTASFVDSSVFSLSEFNIIGSTKAEFSGENGVSRFDGAFYVGNTSSSDAEIEISGGSHVFKGSIYVGRFGSGTFKLTGGTVSNQAGAGSAFAYLGVEPNSFGRLSVSGGRFSMPGSNGIQVGYKGRGCVSLSGGEIRTPRIRLGSFDSSSPMDEDVFEQSGGVVDLFYLDAGFGMQAAICANRKARVSLTGGVMKCARFAAGAGTAEFYANGGTIEVPGANTEFFNGFSLAELGPKGLEIRSDYDITAAQEFTKADNGGRLVLSGSGVKTFTAEGTALSEVEIVGGKAVFPSGIAALGAVSVRSAGTLAFDGEPPASAVTSLVLGDEESFGVLEVKAGSPIKVAGDVIVKAAKIVLNGEFSSGEAGCDYRIVEFSGEMSEESEKRLALAVAEGLADGDVAEFSLTGAAGSRGIAVKIRKRSDLTIRLDSGVSNATENVSFAYGETLTAFAGAEAALTMSGAYGCGRFVKEGSGRVALVSGESRFLGGMLLAGGMLSLGDLNALVSDDPMSAGAMVLSNGTLEITAPAEGLRLSKPMQFEAAPTNMLYAAQYWYGNDAVVVKCDVPLTMPVPSPANAAFIKRGSAPMVIEAQGTVDFPARRGHDVFGYDPAYTSEYVFDDFGNVPANFVYPALSVVDGELKLKGAGEEPAEFDIHGSLMLSVPTKSVTVQPSLVLDNAKLINKGDGTRAYLGWYNNHANSNVDCITLALTNNSEFSADTIHVNKNAAAGAKVRIDADASKLVATYQLNAGYGSQSDIVYSFRNSSQLLAKSVSLNSTVTLNFDSSKFAKNTALDPVGIIAYGMTAFNFNFRNGSEFICNSISSYYDNTTALKINLLFENSKWTPGAGDFDFASAAAKGGTYVQVEGSGLVLEPPSGKTWTMGLPVSGDGGMVIGGEGRVLLDGSKWAALGTVKIMEGSTLDLGGTTADDLFVTGGGTLENAVVSGGVAIRLNEDASAAEEGLPLLRNVSFSGPARVKLELTGGALQPPYRTVAVARYDGDVPDVGSWRLVKNPADRMLGAKFTAENGTVYMTPGKYGTVLIIR